MNKVGSAAKVKLNSFDDLFGTEQPQAGIEAGVMTKMDDVAGGIAKSKEEKDNVEKGFN